MPQFNTDSSLQRLLKMIPPPASPLEVDGELASLAFLGGKKVTYPSDYLPLVQSYGSGVFDDDMRNIARVHIPCSAAYLNKFEKGT